MRTFSLIALLSLLAAPLAAAGGAGVDVAYMESQESCVNESYYDESSWYWSDPNHTSWWGGSARLSQWSHACHTNVTTASVEARDDDGTLAYARVGGSDSSSWTNSYSEYSNYYQSPDHSSGTYRYWSTGGHSDSYARGVEAGAAGTEAEAGRTCGYSAGSDYSWRESGSSSRWNDGNSTYSWYDYSNQHHSREGDASGCWLGADAGDARAGLSTGCSREEARANTYEESSYGNEQYTSSSTFSGRTTDGCHELAQASAADQSAAAGRRDACESDSWAWEQDGAGHSYSSSSCSSGIVVMGPDGMELFIGTQFRGWQDCAGAWEERECWDDQYNAAGAQLSWSHSPMGPDPTGIWYPLP